MIARPRAAPLAAGPGGGRRRVVARDDGGGDELVAEELAAGGDGDEVGALAGLDGLVEGLELLLGGLVVDVPEVDKVDGRVALLHLLGEGDELLLLVVDGRADEYHYALALGVVLTVFEGELFQKEMMVSQDATSSTKTKGDTDIAE